MMLLFGKPESAILAPLSGPEDTPPINIDVRFDNWNGSWGLGVEVKATTAYLVKAVPTDKEYDESLAGGSGVEGIDPIRIVAETVKRIPITLQRRGGKQSLSGDQTKGALLDSREDFLSQGDKVEEKEVERAALRWQWRLRREDGEAGSVVFFSTGNAYNKAVTVEPGVRLTETKVGQQGNSSSTSRLRNIMRANEAIVQAQEIHVETPAEVQVFAWGNNQYGT